MENPGLERLLRVSSFKLSFANTNEEIFNSQLNE